MVDLDQCYAKADVPRSSGGDVAGWIVETLGAHPLWHSYWVSVMHLRPVPGASIHYYLPDATHEMWLTTLNPEMPRQAMLDTAAFHVLTPMNFAAQFIARHDAEAMERVERAVVSICDGSLSPDTDFISAWVCLFGDNMMKRGPVRHVRVQRPASSS